MRSKTLIWAAIVSTLLEVLAVQAHARSDLASVQEIDGAPVLFKYGDPIPAFESMPDPSPTRMTLSLDGEWRFATDPEDEGSEKGWARPSFDHGDWLSVTVPHTWDYQGSGNLSTYDGAVWYRKTFRLPDDASDRLVRLVFLGAAERARVYVNGEFVAQHRGAYTPFALDITDKVDPRGPNLLAVRLDRRPWGTFDPTRLPASDHDWWLYGGIFRSVRLELVPRISTVKASVGYQKGSRVSRIVIANKDQAPRQVRVDFQPEREAPWQSERLTVAPGGVRVASFSDAVSRARLWSPDDPQIQTGKVVLTDFDTGTRLDEFTFEYGLSDVRVAGSRLLLNGEPLTVKGVNWHTDRPRVGSAYSRDDFVQDLQLTREAGANLVRLSHYPRHPIVYGLADRMGLLLIDEAPNYWLDGRAISAQLQDGLAQSLVREMVWNHANHPSVALWSILNESETGVRGGTSSRRFIAELTESAHTLDPSGRPVTYASNRLRDDIGFDLVDLIGINEYFGFFYGKSDDLGTYLDWLHRRHPQKPILIMEFGDWAVRGTSRETIQARTFSDHWRQITARSRFVAGAIWWVFADHRSRHQPNSAIPYISTMGLVDRDRRPKEAFSAFRDAPGPADLLGR